MTKVKEVAEVLETKRSDVLNIDPRNIEVMEGFNVRKDYGDIDALADSIRANGVIVPLRGFKEGEKFIITDGHRRLAACMKLVEEGVTMRVPFVSGGKGYNEERRIIDMIISNDGKNLNPVEEAEAITRLSNLGLTDKEISQKTGRNIVTISGLKSIASAPTKVKRMIESGQIAATEVLQIVRKEKDASKVVEVIERAVESAKASGKKKATAKDLKKASGKHSSVSDLKKLIKVYGEVPVRDAKSLEFALAVLNGDISYEEMEARFFTK